MPQDSNIFFKLELTKINKSLNVNIHLNPYAKNINHDEQTITWMPTKDEQTFLLESLELIKQHEINDTFIFQKKNQQTQSKQPTISSGNIKPKPPKKEHIKTTAEDQWESINREIDTKLHNR